MAIKLQSFQRSEDKLTLGDAAGLDETRGLLEVTLGRDEVN